MSNTTVSPSSLFDTLAETFFTWFHSDILPVCCAIFTILVFVISLVLNILLLVTVKQRGLLNEPSTYFAVMLCVVDFIACFLLVLPTMITSIAKEWVLSDPLCQLHGSIMFFVVAASFGFVALLSIERAIKLCHEDVEVYDKIFENKKVRAVLILLVMFIPLAMAFVPLGLDMIRYDFYHQGCMLDYTINSVFVIVHFLLTIVISLIIAIVCFSMIFHSRKKALVFERQSKLQKVEHDRLKTMSNSSSISTPLETIAENDDVFGQNNEPNNNNNKTNNHQASTSNKKSTDKPGKNKNKKRPRSSRRQSMLFEVFSDDEENPAFHLALTYLYVWAIIFVCYLPYMIVSFYGAFNDGAIWGGFYTVTMLIVYVSFAVKPIVYLGHNRHYQQVTRQTIPEGVRNRARSVRNSISSLTDSVQDFIFRSRANRRFNAALAAQKAVLIWKRKAKTKKISLKPGDSTVKKTPVLATMITNKPSDHPPPSGLETSVPLSTVREDVEPQTGNGHAPIVSSMPSEVAPPKPPPNAPTPNLGHSITPSEVNVGEPSTFIERERERMRMMASGGNMFSSGRHDGSPTGGNWGSGNGHDPSPVPGMIDDSMGMRNNGYQY